MKRVLGHVMAGLLATAGAAAVVSACAHDDSTLFIFNAIAPTPVSAGGTCTFSANPSQPYINSGFLDVALGGSYTAEFLVGNQLVAQADPTVPRTETSIIKIEGAVVRITTFDGTQIASYTNLTSGGIQAASGGTPSYAAVGVTVVDNATVQNYGPPFGSLDSVRLITYSKIFGKTLGGQYVESDEFEFPVDMCRGCLIQFSESDISPLCRQPNCVGAATSTNTTPTGPCIAGQDIRTDCSACRGTIAECNPNANTCGSGDGGTTD